MADYGARIKDICDSYVSINVTFEEDEMVQVCLGELMSRFRSFRTTVYTREKSLSFDLKSMLLVEENHTGALTSMHANNKIVYTEEDRPCGHGG